MGITKAPKSFKSANSLVKKMSNVNPVGVLKKKAIQGTVKNTPKKSSPALDAISQERKARQRATGMC